MKLQEIEEIRINCKKKNYIGILLIILAAVFIFLAQLELDFAPVFVGGCFISMITGIIFVAIANIKFSKIKKEFKYKYLKFYLCFLEITKHCMNRLLVSRKAHFYIAILNSLLCNLSCLKQSQELPFKLWNISLVLQCMWVL